jgi:glutathione synthase/RimK-type ligase-like ATP-grasp enzyme
MRAVLFKSEERFDAFKKQLEDLSIETTVLDFEKLDWIDFNFKEIDLVIYYPSFQYNSNYPLALWYVHDNLKFILENNPHLVCFPDVGLFKYYNDKYNQYLYLKKNNLPVPLTIPFYSKNQVDEIEKYLGGYPVVIKNRYGAGGDNVFKADSRKELINYYNFSTFNLFNIPSFLRHLKIFSKRLFYYHLIKEKQMPYLFLSPPILVQKFVEHDKDLKLVLNNDEVIEGHWRSKASESMWKVNIDGGGVGEWSFIPDNALDIGKNLAKKLNSHWLNIDLFSTKNGFLISEFSPVWHHYAYKEKPSFIYKDDYNLNMDLKEALNLEKIIVDSLVKKIKT